VASKKLAMAAKIVKFIALANLLAAAANVSNGC